MSPEARQFLYRLETRPGAYGELLEEHKGDIVRAGHALAVARVRTYSTPTTVPTHIELRVAVQEIAHRAHWTGPIPSPREVAALATDKGLLVISP